MNPKSVLNPANKSKTLNHADPIASEVYRRFQIAQTHRASDMLGNKSVETILTNSYNQYHGIHDPCDQELVEESGIDAYLSITKLKVKTSVDFIRDLISTQGDTLITVDPTLIPELSKAGRAQAIAQYRQFLNQNGTPFSPEEHLEMARQFKEIQMQNEYQLATKEAKRQQKIINDQLIETKFKREFLKFLKYFMRDPYAVMIGPIKRGETVLTWSGNRLVDKSKVGNYSTAPDPRDYFYAPDANGHGSGAYEIVREQMSRQTLNGLINAQGWIGKNIEQCVNEYTHFSSYNWMAQGGSENKGIIPWGNSDSITVLRHFGLFSGEELQPFGLSVEPDKFYETMAITCGGYTLKLEVNVDQSAQRRRVYTSSYDRSPDRVAGVGLSQDLRDIERGFMASLRKLMENLGFSALPSGEVDFSRIQRYMPAESIGAVLSGTMIPTDPDVVGGNRPAHHYHNHPNLSGAISNLMSFWMQLGDQFSGVPAALHGQPIGTGANRTFRGMMALYSNAMKGLQSGLMNLDDDILGPIGQSYHYVNIQEHKFRGDARINVSGVTGLLKAELKKQEAMENMQLIAQIASSNPQGTPVGAMNSATSEVLKALGVSDQDLGTPTIGDLQAQQQQQLQQNSVPGQ